MSFVTHSNECVTNEPQRTSVGRLRSNDLVENAVKQAKNLLCKYKKDGSDSLLGLLNLRNVPRDQTLGPTK